MRDDLPKNPLSFWSSFTKVLLFNLMPTHNMEATGEAFFFEELCQIIVRE